MPHFPLSSDDEGINDLNETPDTDDDLLDERVVEDDLASSTTDEQRIEALMAEARSRDDGDEPPFESNYEYVLERINELDEPLLAERYWKQGSATLDDTASENIVADAPMALVIDDDKFSARQYGLMLSAAGIKITYAFTADDALRIVNQRGDIFSFIVIDIRMPVGDYLSSYDTGAGMKTGIFLAMEMIEGAGSAALIALSNSTDSLDISWFEARQGCFYCQKNQFPPEQFLKFIRVNIMKDFSALKTFIIHGHDKVAALSLKNYLQNRLGFSEPIILSEQKSKGMTIIEKLEHYLADVDLVFALFTPDDFVTHPKTTKRARQNVVLEFGYVLGMLGRKSGRIFYLYKDGVEIPSDLAGVAYIDISNGIESAGEEIRLELEDWLS